MRSKARARKLAKSRFSLSALSRAALLFLPLLLLLPDALFRRRHRDSSVSPTTVHHRVLVIRHIFTRGRRRIFARGSNFSGASCSGFSGFSGFPCMHRSRLRCFDRRHKLSGVMGNAAGAVPDFAPAGRESSPSEYFNSTFSFFLFLCVSVCACSGRVLCRPL